MEPDAGPCNAFGHSVGSGLRLLRALLPLEVKRPPLEEGGGDQRHGSIGARHHERGPSVEASRNLGGRIGALRHLLQRGMGEAPVPKSDPTRPLAAVIGTGDTLASISSSITEARTSGPRSR